MFCPQLYGVSIFDAVFKKNKSPAFPVNRKISFIIPHWSRFNAEQVSSGKQGWMWVRMCAAMSIFKYSPLYLCITLFCRPITSYESTRLSRLVPLSPWKESVLFGAAISGVVSISYPVFITVQKFLSFMKKSLNDVNPMQASSLVYSFTTLRPVSVRHLEAAPRLLTQHFPERVGRERERARAVQWNLHLSSVEFARNSTSSLACIFESPV